LDIVSSELFISRYTTIVFSPSRSYSFKAPAARANLKAVGPKACCSNQPSGERYCDRSPSAPWRILALVTDAPS